VAEVGRLPIGMTTLQDAADAFLDQHDPARSTDASTGPPLPAWSLASAFRVAALGVRQPTSFTPLVARAHGCRRTGPRPEVSSIKAFRSFQRKPND
jgi:hypothetical protein